MTPTNPFIDIKKYLSLYSKIIIIIIIIIIS